MRRIGMRAAAAAAAATGAMVPPFEDMPGVNPELPEGSVPPDTPEGGLCTMPDWRCTERGAMAIAL